MGKFKINPFTGKLDRVISDEEFQGKISIFSQLKEPVSTQALLPLSGNVEGDLRVTTDTDNLWVWGISASSGILTDWKVIGNMGTLVWGAITGTLSNQTDLQTELTDRFSKSTDTSDNITEGTKKFTTAGDISKLAGIESGAQADQDASEVPTSSSGVTVQSKLDSIDSQITDLEVGSVNFVIDGSGIVIPLGIFPGDIKIDFNCVIEEVTLLADQTGSVVIDIWKDTYANFPPSVADSITASSKPTITTNTKSQDVTLTGWTTSISAGDILRFNVDSVTDIQSVSIVLKIRRV